MRFQVASKRLEYDLKFYGKYTVIQGDSGNGKTNLCRLLRDRQIGDKTIKIDSTMPVLTLDASSDGDELNNIRDSIIVIDEYYKVLRNDRLGSILKEGMLWQL